MEIVVPGLGRKDVACWNLQAWSAVVHFSLWTYSWCYDLCFLCFLVASYEDDIGVYRNVSSKSQNPIVSTADRFRARYVLKVVADESQRD